MYGIVWRNPYTSSIQFIWVNISRIDPWFYPISIDSAGVGPLNSHMFWKRASKLVVTSTRHPSTCPTLIPLYCAVITGTTNLRATWCIRSGKTGGDVFILHPKKSLVDSLDWFLWMVITYSMLKTTLSSTKRTMLGTKKKVDSLAAQPGHRVIHLLLHWDSDFFQRCSVTGPSVGMACDGRRRPKG